MIQGDHGTDLVLLQTLDHLHAILERFFARLVNLILLDHVFERRFLGFGLFDLPIQIGELIVQAGVPPVAAAGKSESDDNQQDRRKIFGQSELRARFCLLATCSNQIDSNHWSNPLKAKPTATASAGPRDVSCAASTFGPAVMDRNGSKTSVG